MATIKITNENGYRPLAAILFFCGLFLAVAFYDSRKVILWESQDTATGTVFKQLVFDYASAAENVKMRAELGGLFQKENVFWKSLKESPLVFGQPQSEDILVSQPDSDNRISQGEEPIPAANKNEPIDSGTKDFPLVPALELPALGGEAASSTSAASSTAPVGAKIPLKQISPGNKLQFDLSQKKTGIFNVLIIGDSFVAVGGGLGDPLERVLLNYQDLTVTRQGKVSSGLSRKDYFDWYLVAKKLNAQYQPNVAILMFGANDNKPIMDASGKVLASYGSRNWNEQYAKRIDEMLDLFTQTNAEIFVIGIPIMKNKVLSADIERINSIGKTEVGKYKNAHFISTWELLTDANGNYTDYILDKDGKQRLTRTSDGVHLQYFAGYYVTDYIVSEIKKTLDLKSK